MGSMTSYHWKIREFSRYIGGKRVIEILLEPKQRCRYYWKAQIHMGEDGTYRVRFFDRFGEPYGCESKPGEETGESLLFHELDEAKIHVRRTLLNQ